MFKTPEDAFMAYKTAKECYIKEVVLSYAGQIPQRLYDVMYNHEIQFDA